MFTKPLLTSTGENLVYFLRNFKLKLKIKILFLFVIVDQTSGCPRCLGAVFEAEKLSANGIR